MLEGLYFRVQVPRLVPTDRDNVIEIGGVGDAATNYYTDGNARGTTCCSCDNAEI